MKLVGMPALVIAAGLLVWSAAQAQYQEITVRDGGTIEGHVRLAGTAPVHPAFEVTKDKTCCGVSKPSTRLMLGTAQGVANAVVYLEGIARGKKFGPSRRVVLTQHQCEFVPHLLILRATDRLEIVNNDPVLHNVHAYDVHAENAGLFNLAQPIKGQKSTVAPSQFRNASLVMTGCDAGHPWMNGYIVRAVNPYYALTGADGSFRFDDVPPGSYKLVMWHEGVQLSRTDKEKGVPTRYTFEPPYQETLQVTVSPGSRTQADFTLTLR